MMMKIIWEERDKTDDKKRIESLPLENVDLNGDNYDAANGYFLW